MIWDVNNEKAVCGLAGPMVDLLMAAETNNELF